MVEVRLIGNQVVAGSVFFDGSVVELDDLDAGLLVKLGRAEYLTTKATKGHKKDLKEKGGAEVTDG